jgi:L-asparagine oxygenase
MEKNIIKLEPIEVKILINLAKLIDVSPIHCPNIFCTEAKQLSKSVPQRIVKILKTFVKKGNDHGFILIDGLPKEQETLPSKILSNIQAILIKILGEMISYEAEGDGKLFQRIIPNKSMEKTQASMGSGVELEIHTEQAFSKMRPDILCLACVRGDPNAFTYIFPVNYILAEMTSYERTLLRQPLWKIGIDLSFKINDHEFIEGDIRGPIPIISGPQDNEVLVFDQDLMVGITEEADEIIKKIVRLYYNYRIAHNLTANEIIFIDNNRAVHGRSPFKPKYDDTDRFLIRCFCTYDYKKSEYARFDHSRTIRAIYS